MEPDNAVVQMNTGRILEMVMDGADGQVDRRRVSDNIVLGLVAEVEALRLYVLALQDRVNELQSGPNDPQREGDAR